MKIRTFLIGTSVLMLGGTFGLVRFANLASGEGSGQVQSDPTDSEKDLAAALEEDMRSIALYLGERNPRKTGSMRAAVDLLGGRVEGMGYEPKYLDWTARGQTASNIEVTIPGSLQRSEIVVVGAHYDSYRDSPCADATASGTATLLALMERARGKTFQRTVKFVLFANGERPVRDTEDWGAERYVAQALESGDNIVAMVCIGPFGYFSSEPGSQGYFFPFNLFWPGTGDFVSIVGDPAARSLVRTAARTWQLENRLPVVAGAVPSWWPGMQTGDHDAFQARGIPSVLVSDSGDARFDDIRTVYDQYHRMNFESMARAVLELERFLPAFVRDL